jgi:hypothetical protein
MMLSDREVDAALTPQNPEIHHLPKDLNKFPQFRKRNSPIT